MRTSKENVRLSKAECTGVRVAYVRGWESSPEVEGQRLIKGQPKSTLSHSVVDGLPDDVDGGSASETVAYCGGETRDGHAKFGACSSRWGRGISFRPAFVYVNRSRPALRPSSP